MSEEKDVLGVWEQPMHSRLPFRGLFSYEIISLLNL